MSTARLSDNKQWELFIPEMGYMALLRNLRNFDDSGVSDKTARAIGKRLADPDEVAKSKQFPYAFHSAWLNVPSARWKNYLNKALNYSVPNLPLLDGRNLVLVDTSGSMAASMSVNRPNRSRRSVNPSTGQDQYMSVKVPTRMAAGALFGIALGMKNKGNVDLWHFATGQEDLTSLTNPPAGEGVLDAMGILEKCSGRVGHGTDIGEAIRNTYRGHDRVFIFTDMQSMPDENYPSAYDVTSGVPGDKHVYGFNLAGYSDSSMGTGRFRHEMGGLTDATFSLIRNIEAGMSGEWPWS
jgi:TROVE domain